MDESQRWILLKGKLLLSTSEGVHPTRFEALISYSLMDIWERSSRSIRTRSAGSSRSSSPTSQPPPSSSISNLSSGSPKPASVRGEKSMPVLVMNDGNWLRIYLELYENERERKKKRVLYLLRKRMWLATYPIKWRKLKVSKHKFMTS